MAKDLEFVLSTARAIMDRDPQKSWFSKLPPDAQKRLAGIKTAYEDGRFVGISRAAVCKAVVALLTEQKWPVPKSKNTIQRWLSSSDI